ncbi:MAG: glycosyltransferase family 4 protein [Acidimicrobiaceae bacterium]|nr:glycosyltransferase family 4 protein [Acidimicrobiaceae bacterium]
MTNLRRVAFVTHRYSTEVIGGAEQAARMMAENLARELGLTVEVLTTTSLNAGTWKNHYPSGTEEINGIKVRRFRVDQGRSKEFSELSGRLLRYPRSATLEESEQWIDAQGPVSHSLVKAIENVEAEVIFFFPYLYHPIVKGIAAVRDRAVLIPAAHDEPPAYLPIFQDVFQAAKAIMFQSKAEEHFVDSVLRTADKPRLRAGLGIEKYDRPIEPLVKHLPDLDGNPFLLTLGRVDQLKGATLLSELFAEFKRRNPSPLKLVFAGPVTTQPVDFPDILVLGPVSESIKWSLLTECTALVNPSAFESFSLVLFEAWSLSRPVLVNAQCLVTADHVTDSAGGFIFSNYAEFEAQVNFLLSSSDIRQRLGLNGHNYLEKNYRWDVIVKKMGVFLTDVFNP